MRDVAQPVSELREYVFDERGQGKLEAVIGGAKLLVQTYLETAPGLPDDIMVPLREAQLDTNNVATACDHLDRLLGVAQRWRASMVTSKGVSEDLFAVLWTFLEYARTPVLDWRINHS